MAFSLGNLISAGVQSGAGYLRGQVQGNEIQYERDQRKAELERRDALLRQQMMQNALLDNARIEELNRRNQPKPVAAGYDPNTDLPTQRALYLRRNAPPKEKPTLTPDANQSAQNQEAEGQAILRSIPAGQQVKFMRAYGAALKANSGVSPGRIAVHVWQGMKAADPTVTPQRASSGAFGGMPNLSGAAIPDSTFRTTPPADRGYVDQQRAADPGGNLNLTPGPVAPPVQPPPTPPEEDTSDVDPSTLPVMPADLERAKTDTAFANYLRSLGHQL